MRKLVAAFTVGLLFSGLAGLAIARDHRDARSPAGLRIAGPSPGDAPTPVVNERGRQTLRVVDANGQSVTVTKWAIDNRDIARVTKKGVLKGKTYGFATVTATTSRGDVKGFVVVARVTRRQGAMTQGDTKADAGGNIFLSSPRTHVIYQASAIGSNVLAGSSGNSGYADGTGQNARFNFPTGLAVDNTASGGVYVTDTMNHCIRRINRSGRAEVALGIPQVEGTMVEDSTPLASAVVNGPRGVAAVGRNYYFTDTENHAIFYADYQRNEVRLVCGDPGRPDLVDGRGRMARFNRPSGLAISTDGRLLAVADTGNNLIRLVALTLDSQGRVVGDVSKLGVGSSTRGAEMSKQWEIDDPRDAIAFVAPDSVSIDATGNIYVVDQTGASVVTRPKDALPEKVDLAETGTLGDPVSVTLKSTQAFVLDESAAADTSAISIAEVGPPMIDLVTPASGRLEGGEEVVIDGRSFSKESKVTLGDTEVTDYTVLSSRRIRLRVPSQTASGGRTLTVLTRGGVAQRRFDVVAKSLAELAPGEITTVAGGIPYIGDGGAANVSRLYYSSGVSIDGSGNLYIADTFNHRIRQVDTSGRITTIAGTGANGFNGDGQPATAARLNYPHSVTVDGTGSVYIADTYNQRIRRVDHTGQITTVAGTGVAGYNGDNLPATSASLNYPEGIAVDRVGNLYIADRDNNRVRRVDTAGQMTTVAGTDQVGYDGDNKPASTASLNYPRGVAVDESGNLLIADAFNERIRRVDTVGRITTVAGNGVAGYDGDDKPAISAGLHYPGDVSVDGSGNIYIADADNHRIRRVDTTGRITTVAGTGAAGYDGDDKPGATSSLHFPRGIAVDGSGRLYIADAGNQRIRRVDASGDIASIAGTGEFGYDGDDKPATSASLGYPRNVAFDGSDNLYIADSENRRVRRVDSGGRITTFAGTGATGYDGDDKPATSARLDNPFGVAVDRSGSLLIADTNQNRIRRVDGSGRITTVVGTGAYGFNGDNRPAVTASLAYPTSIAVDSAGNLYVADAGNNRVRRIDTAGTITTVAGTNEQGYNGDNIPAVSARLYFPFGVAVDTSGRVYIADTYNHRVRRVDTTGQITTIAGTGAFGYNGDDRPANTSHLAYPFGVAVDDAGNLFIADYSNNRIRRVDTTGRITTIGGSGVEGYAGDDGPAISARLSYPQGVAIDGDGNVFIADTYANAIRAVRNPSGAKGEPAISIERRDCDTTRSNLFVITGASCGSVGIGSCFGIRFGDRSRRRWSGVLRDRTC